MTKSTFTWKHFFYLFIILCTNTIFTRCKKEDHSNHDDDSHTHGIPVPYTPYAVYVAEEEEGKITVINPVENKTIGSIKYRDWETDRKSTRLNSSHSAKSRMPSSA